MITDPFPRRHNFLSGRERFDDDWRNIAVVDDETGAEVKLVFQFDIDAGLVMSWAANYYGKPFVCTGDPRCAICDNREGDHPAAVRHTGSFHLERRADA